jgi:YHS domain-containing protein
MTRFRLPGVCVLLVLLGAADQPEKRAPKEALQALQILIGSWRGSGLPEGTREEKQKGLWEETIRWEWQFKEKDVFLKATFDKGKYFAAAELRYLPEKDTYQLTATTPAKEKLIFEGPFKDKRLTLERTDDKSKENQRLVVSLLHDNRYLYKYEVKPAEKPAFKALYQVGATKEGVPFATADYSTECIVSGGKGTMPVTYLGKTYYVCCGGCKDAFNDDPAKYVKEFEERKQKNK